MGQHEIGGGDLTCFETANAMGYVGVEQVVKALFVGQGIIWNATAFLDFVDTTESSGRWFVCR